MDFLICTKVVCWSSFDSRQHNETEECTTEIKTCTYPEIGENNRNILAGNLAGAIALTTLGNVTAVKLVLTFIRLFALSFVEIDHHTIFAKDSYTTGYSIFRTIDSNAVEDVDTGHNESDHVAALLEDMATPHKTAHE